MQIVNKQLRAPFAAGEPFSELCEIPGSIHPFFQVKLCSGYLQLTQIAPPLQ